MKPSISQLTLAALLGLSLSACQQMPVAPSQTLQAQIQTQSDAGVTHASTLLVNNLISRFDSNGDGKLDQSEIKIPLLLRLLDKNHDGFLTPDEMHQPLAVKIVAGFLHATAAKTFGLSDKNHDKSLDYAEFIVKPDLDNKLSQLLFRLSDNNFDDRLNLSEYEDFLGESLAVGGQGLEWLMQQPLFVDAVQ